MSTRANVARDEVTVSGSPVGAARLPDHNGRLAVFDLDRTLLPGSSLSLFGLALHRAGMVGSRRMAGYLAREAVFVRRGQGVSAAHRLLAALLADVTDREAAPLLDVAEGLGDDLARTARPGARWLLDRHLAAGDFCVIASASPQPLVEAAARALGAHRAVGTRAEVRDGRFTGRLDGPFCHGRGKLARLWFELGTPGLSQATAYSDSMSDLPLLTAAGRPVAVNPDRRLRREARTQGWPVLTF
jgi:HAD superfamily hydrolase (TIGR01490 family)